MEGRKAINKSYDSLYSLSILQPNWAYLDICVVIFIYCLQKYKHICTHTHYL